MQQMQVNSKRHWLCIACRLMCRITPGNAPLQQKEQEWKVTTRTGTLNDGILTWWHMSYSWSSTSAGSARRCDALPPKQPVRPPPEAAAAVGVAAAVALALALALLTLALPLVEGSAGAGAPSACASPQCSLGKRMVLRQAHWVRSRSATGWFQSQTAQKKRIKAPSEDGPTGNALAIPHQARSCAVRALSHRQHQQHCRHSLTGSATPRSCRWCHMHSQLPTC